MADTIHIVSGLGLEGGRDRDDAPTRGSGTKEKPGKDMSLEFVLAGLAGEDDHKGESQVVKDGFFDRKGYPALVGTEVDTAGGSPTDGVAADGCADTICEDGEGGRRHGEWEMGNGEWLMENGESGTQWKRRIEDWIGHRYALIELHIKVN
jgi:hypothetical protein